ncbi:MAG TPA: copper homeostasis periplasmic binding protein CopC [Dongiaceae bacterium]|jgi:methionine-rich copper-binding protein CopC|nr:copper homeostasis periplasmic binding protein CopC [Dongiaceae bacterium]
MRKIAIALLASTLSAAGVTAALAHAELESSVPAADATVKEAPKTIEIDFSEELNAKLSKIEVQDSMGMQVDKGDSHVASDNEKHLSVDLNALGAGTYKVLWTSVASDDGHKLTGSYAFTVQP